MTVQEMQLFLGSYNPNAEIKVMIDEDNIETSSEVIGFYLVCPQNEQTDAYCKKVDSMKPGDIINEYTPCEIVGIICKK